MSVYDWYSLFQWFSLVAGALAFASLAGTVFFGLRANKASSLQILDLQVQAADARKDAERIKADAAKSKQQSDEKIAELAADAERSKAEIALSHKESAEANARAREADREAAEASSKAEGFRLDIAKANERASQADLARRQLELQLAMRFADRTLTQSQIDRAVALLLPFQGQTVDLTVFGDTPEINQFSNIVLKVFGEAKWVINISHPLGSGSARGVLLGVRPSSGPALASAAGSLISVMRESLLDGVGMWDFDKVATPGGASMESQMIPTGMPDAKPVPRGQAPLRVVIGSKI
jgi:hypothetical protein